MTDDEIREALRLDFEQTAVHHENIVRRAHAPPEGGGNALWLVPHIFEADVGKRIRHLERTLDGIGVKTILKKWRGPASNDG